MGHLHPLNSEHKFMTSVAITLLWLHLWSFQGLQGSLLKHPWMSRVLLGFQVVITLL